jgi:hypothetical protein
MSKRTNTFYRAARLSADVDAARRGRLHKRVMNRAIGRTLARAGFWKGLWR